MKQENTSLSIQNQYNVGTPEFLAHNRILLSLEKYAAVNNVNYTVEIFFKIQFKPSLMRTHRLRMNINFLVPEVIRMGSMTYYKCKKNLNSEEGGKRTTENEQASI